MCVSQYLAHDRCPYGLSLVLGRYAKRVQLNILPAFNGHEEPNSDTATLDQPRVFKLKLLSKLLPFFGFIPKTTGSRDMGAHSTQKHVFNESYILVSCAPRA